MRIISLIIGVAIVGIFFLIGLVVMWLWNWIMPYLFSTPEISFWMACGIVILVGLIFSGYKGLENTVMRRRK